MRRSLLILTLLLVSAHPGFAQELSEAAKARITQRFQHAQQFNQKHGAGWKIRWHANGQTPATLMGSKTKSYEGSRKEAGRAFLRDNRKLLGIENVRRNLRVDPEGDSGEADVSYQQVYKGVPVLDSGYLVAANEDGQVYYVSGDYHPGVHVSSITPALQPEDVVRIIQKDLGTTDIEVFQKPELAISVDENTASPEKAETRYRLVYWAQAGNGSTEDNEYRIDAMSGEVLSKVTLIKKMLGGNIEANGSKITQSAESRESDRDTETSAVNKSNATTATGKVYMTNPTHNDLNSNVTIERLYPYTPLVLFGDNIHVSSWVGYDAEAQNGEFKFDTNSYKFDQVMVYYHSDEFEEWLVNSLGMPSGKLYTRVDATTSYKTESDVDDPLGDHYLASSDPAAKTMRFSDEDLTFNHRHNNPTKEAAVITHEYMHLVSEQYHQGLNPGGNCSSKFFDECNEGQKMMLALDEAYSDYFSIAYRYAVGGVSSTVQGEYTLRTLNPRDLDNSHTMSDFFDIDVNGDDNSGEHDKSVIFSGALWDFRSRGGVNNQTVDELVLESLGLLNNYSSPITFTDARDALVAAANNYSDLGYPCKIKADFASHGIGSACPAMSVSIEGPESLAGGETGTWTANVSNNDEPINWYHWWYRSPGDVEWQWLGYGDSNSHQMPNSRDLELGVEVCTSECVIINDYLVTNTDLAPSLENASSQDSVSTTASLAETGSKTAATTTAPDKYTLKGNSPNPFRSQTTLRYGLPEQAEVHLRVYNALGQEITRLASGSQEAGWHTVQFEAGDLPAGVYLVRMRAGSFATTQQVVLTR